LHIWTIRMNNAPKSERKLVFSRLSLKIIAAISISVLVIQLAFLGYIERRISASEHAKVVIRAAINYPDGKESLYVGEELTDLEYGFDVKDFDADDNLITIATLSTYATTEFIDEARDSRLKSLLGLIFLVFFVVLAMSALAVQAYVGVPIKRITQAISDKSGMPKIIWNSRDEMGTVVSRLNFQLSGLEQELSDNERREAARITSLANATLEGILIFKDDNIIDMNEPMADLIGRDRDSLIDTSVANLVEADVLKFLQQPVIEGTRPNIGASLTNSENVEVPVEIYLTSMEDESSYSKVAVVRDVSERVATEKVMWRLAHYDSLTDLPNRRYFSEKLTQAILDAKLNNTALSVAYLDLDNFKFVNDSRGHAVGDELLCKVSESVQKSLGANGQCARLGGDEFAIFFEEKNLDSSLEEILNNVLVGVHEGEECRAWNSIFGVSIGAATLVGEEVSESELFTRADLALYKAKESGRAQVCFYSENIDAKLKRERLIEERLAPALERDELEVYYQAQVVCDSSKLTGFEALLRWNDPILGSVSPLEIIEIAERAGLLLELGRWVISKACEDASFWPPQLKVAVNVSPLQLVDEKLPSFISSCLERTGLPAERFEVEITESALVSDASKAEEILATFKEMGILIALDDFGTGYSSLSMLQNFPFDRIKIDRSFVSNLSDDKGKASIVASM